MAQGQKAHDRRMALGRLLDRQSPLDHHHHLLLVRLTLLDHHHHLLHHVLPLHLRLLYPAPLLPHPVNQ
jgi:hypothetical protein